MITDVQISDLLFKDQIRIMVNLQGLTDAMLCSHPLIMQHPLHFPFLLKQATVLMWLSYCEMN